MQIQINMVKAQLTGNRLLNLLYNCEFLYIFTLSLYVQAINKLIKYSVTGKRNEPPVQPNFPRGGSTELVNNPAGILVNIYTKN